MEEFRHRNIPDTKDSASVADDDHAPLIPHPNRPSSLPLISRSLSNYGSLDDARPDHHTELDDFLAVLGIVGVEPRLPLPSLLKLFQQEMSTYSAFKWSSVDHALEKLLQWPLLSTKDLAPDAKNASCARIRLAERSILLKGKWSLAKAYGAQGFVHGLELGIFTSIHVFIYAMLLYRLIVTVQTGKMDLADFRDSFVGSEEKGITTLTHLLAHVEEAQWLELILASPLIIGFAEGLSSMRGTRIPIEELEALITEVDQYPDYSGLCSWLVDGLYEYLPVISSRSELSFSGKLSKLERIIRWDGHLNPTQRRSAFDAISRIAQRGKKTVRLNALQCLAKIAHGVGFKDMARLKVAGYSSEELATMLYIKGKALEVLESALSDNNSFFSIPGMYQQYLLWCWLGLKTKDCRWKLAVLLKMLKLYGEWYFILMILFSLREAICCPDKPGFELGFGYSQYADLLTIDCYLQMINQFRSVNLSDSVEQLVNQTRHFNLQGLRSLELDYKSLRGKNMVDILQSVEANGARLIELTIHDYFTDADMQALSVYLNTSNITTMWLGSNDIIYGGGEGLSAEGLWYLSQVLPWMKQLTCLWLGFPNINDSGIESLADILNTTRINRLYLPYMNFSDKAGTKIAQALATMRVERLLLSSSQIGDDTIHALAAVIQNSPMLAELCITGDLITNAGSEFFAKIIRHTSLDALCLHSATITDAGLIVLTDSLIDLPLLTTLEIGSNSGEAGSIYLFQQLNKTNITWFELWHHVFTNNSMQVLADSLSSTLITELILVRNNLTSSLIRQLAAGIAASTISSLSIWSNDLSDFIELLGLSLANITTLSITNANLTDTSLTTLVPFLTNSKIQVLDLDFNQIGDSSILALAKILPQTLIKHLGLENKSLTDIGANLLATVYNHSTLKTLNLTGNNISANILYQIQNVVWQQYCQDLLCHANAPYNRGATNVVQGLCQIQSENTGFSFGFHETETHSTPLVTSSASRVQPMFVNLILIPWRYFTAPSPISHQHVLPVPVLTTSSATLLLPSRRMITTTPEISCYEVDGSSLCVEVGTDHCGVERAASPALFDTSSKALMRPMEQYHYETSGLLLVSPTAHQEIIRTGGLAALHGAFFQSLTLACLAAGYSRQGTQAILGALQTSATVIVSLRAKVPTLTLLLPVMAGKAVTTVMQGMHSPKMRYLAPAVGAATTMMAMVWQQPTPEQISLLATTLVCARVAERLTDKAMQYLLSTNHQPLPPTLLRGKILSLQREYEHSVTLLQKVRKHHKINVTHYTRQLQHLHSTLQNIVADGHATLHTIIALRRAFHQLQQSLHIYHPATQTPSMRSTVLFFSHSPAPKPPQAAKAKGCLDRLYRRMGF